MDLHKCKDPRWRRLFVFLAALLVFIAALSLYLFGWLLETGILYSLAVILLFCFALAGSIAFALLLYAFFRRWCELRGAPPKGKGARELGPEFGAFALHDLQAPRPASLQPVFFHGARLRRDLG